MMYIALTRACNYGCPCCPCKDHSLESSLSFEEIKARIEKISENDKSGVTLSGGEPTIHPQFLDVLSLLYNKNIPVTLLTNSSKITDINFADKIIQSYPTVSKISIITTLYNINKDKHDAETMVKGSFNNSIVAIKMWNSLGAKVTVKHCVTQNNYMDLQHFYRMVHEDFEDNIQFQLSGIDYVGMTETLKNDMKLTCKDIRPYLDEMLNYISYLKSNGKDNRVVYISSLPLCCASKKYKNYFVLNGDVGRIDYLSKSKNINARPYDSKKLSVKCSNCELFDECPGTYSSAFDLMGNDYPFPFKKEE